MDNICSLREHYFGDCCLVAQQRTGARVKSATMGSQRLLQSVVESGPELLRSLLAPALKLRAAETIEWRSPLSGHGYREYRDESALRLVGVNELTKRPLHSFWPARGPVWDALGLTSHHRPIFLEAKAHVGEAASPACAAGAQSRPMIEKALREARKFYAPQSKADWSGTFYQYANRLAHHYLLRECNDVPAELVFLYFVNAKQVHGPESIREWRAAIRLLHAALGLPAQLPDGVHEVFCDASELAGLAVS